MDPLRSLLADLLTGGDAARPAADLMRAFPYEKAGIVHEGLPYSAWSLVEHLRIAQQDILDFSRDPDYEARDWPDDYWPVDPQPEGKTAWNAAIEEFEDGLEAMIELVLDEDRDLVVPFPWGDGQTLFREAVMLAEHNAYHSGQLVVIGRLLGAWS